MVWEIGLQKTQNMVNNFLLHIVWNSSNCLTIWNFTYFLSILHQGLQ